MRYATFVLPALLLVSLLAAQDSQDKNGEGPINEKAQKSYNEGLDYLHKRMKSAALDCFKKADKQDGGHCVGCQKKMVRYGIELQEWKIAETAADELLASAQGEKGVALGHYDVGRVLLTEGIDKRKEELFTRAHDEFVKALVSAPNFPAAVFSDGRALAYLKQDDAATTRFQKFIDMKPENDIERQRALRYVKQPELARARMAPPFELTTTDGQRVSMDDLAGKVVLLDFWATWCGPCREALPHMREIARKFKGDPLVVLSISLDSDEAKWKEFVIKNEMTWPQYRDGGFTGAIATMFSVRSIPHTFTIDADGVLQEEHVGDASVEGKLKKLLARAREVQATQKPEDHAETR